MRLRTRLAITIATAAATAALALPAHASVTMEFVGRAISGDGLAGSEIAAYDATTKRIYVTNGATGKIDIFSIANPAAPTKVKSVTLSEAGDIQSVATNGTLVAAAAVTNATATITSGRLRQSRVQATRPRPSSPGARGG